MLRLKIKDDQYSLSCFGFFFAILSSLLLFDFLFLAEEETVSLVNSNLELEGEEVRVHNDHIILGAFNYNQVGGVCECKNIKS